MALGGDFTPAHTPIIVTAGDVLVPMDPFLVYTEEESVETAVVLTAAVASVKKRRRSNAVEVIADLGVTFDGNEITFAEVTIPDLPGEYWWDLEAVWTDGPAVTLLAGPFKILGQATVLGP